MSPPIPHHPITRRHVSLPQVIPTKLSTVPDLFLSALSACFLFSSSPKPYLTKTLTFSFPFCPRRSLIFSLMPLRRAGAGAGFANPQSLSDWLRPRLPSESFASWGVKPGTKNVHNLWLELAEGETELADSDPPVRSVSVVTVRILSGDRRRILVEASQELSDGTVRERGRPLSEKMKPCEDVEAAAIRAVREELGSVAGDGAVAIVDGSYRKTVEERSSVSYPGLPARYELHSVEAMVEGIPEGEFCTVEESEYGESENCGVADKAVSVKKHFWRWVSVDSMEP